MSTRAVYTFIDNNFDIERTCHIYKHCDGYPSGALEAIKNSIPYAWELPRFEALEFSAAFVSGNKKTGGGNVYLTNHYDNHSDLSYRYEISIKDGNLYFKVFDRIWRIFSIENKHGIKYKLIFEGNLKQFNEFTKDSNSE